MAKGYGIVKREKEDIYFSTQPSDNPSETWRQKDEFEGIEFDLSGFYQANIGDEIGYIPSAEELYGLMGPRQKKWAQNGADWYISTWVNVQNFRSSIGSPEENTLMDHDHLTAEFAGKPVLAKKWAPL